jgi:hypothetical protein
MLVRFHDLLAEMYASAVPSGLRGHSSPISINRRILSFPPGQSVVDDSLVANSCQKGLQRNRELAGIHPQTGECCPGYLPMQKRSQPTRFVTFSHPHFGASQGEVREVEVNCGSYSDRRAYKQIRARGFGWQLHI